MAAPTSRSTTTPLVAASSSASTPTPEPVFNPKTGGDDLIAAVEEWVVIGIQCVESRLPIGADSPFLVPALTVTSLAEEIGLDLVNLGAIGQSVRREGFSGIDDEAIRVATVAGGPLLKQCGKYCVVILKRSDASIARERVYEHLDDAGNVNYYGITDNLRRRSGQHRSDPDITGSTMRPITDPLTHDHARTIEAMKIRER